MIANEEEIDRQPTSLAQSPQPPNTHQQSDERSRMSEPISSTASAVSAATPSSVLVGSPLVRELSDLSGSYLNGSPLPKKLPSTPSRGNHVPQNIYPSDDVTSVSYERPWRQAFILSQPAMHDSQEASPASVTKKAVIMVERNEDVEVIKRNDAEAEGESHRLPLVLLLMDPGKKQYEMLQLWVDVTTDTVRDVLHAMQGKLTDKWKQDYDGLFQIRWQKSSQLIHILSISKYDVVPYEVLIAKPWSMSAKSTIAYAEGLLTHLKAHGMIQFSADFQPNLGSPLDQQPQRLLPRVKSEPPTVLTLSDAAQARIHAPDGILKHHHASQYITFEPPFESPSQRGPDQPDESSASQLSESHCESSNLNTSILESLSTDVIDENDCKEIMVSRGLTVLRDSFTNNRSDDEDGLLFRAHDASLYGDVDEFDYPPVHSRDKSYYIRPRHRPNPFKCISLLLGCSRRRGALEGSLHGPWEKLDEEGQPLPLDSSDTLLDSYSVDDNRVWEPERGALPGEDRSVISETAPLLFHGGRGRGSSSQISLN